MEQKIVYYLNDIKKLQAGEFVPPISCEIDPSNLCNAKCSWCMFKDYRAASDTMLSWDNYLKLIYELQHLGTKSITFTGGGEPTLNPKFNAMVEIAINLGFEVGLITNGILLNKVQNLHNFKFIRVSLDASNRDMYKKIKGVDAFDVVIQNIKDTLQKNRTVGISYVVGPDNADISEMQDLSKSLRVIYTQYKPMFLHNEIFSSYKPEENPYTINTRRHKKAGKLNCIIAHLTGIVTADSSVYYCCQGRGKLNFYLGSISNESFEQIWRRRLSHGNIGISQCPPCRYGNYANYVKELIDEGGLFFEHKHFL